VLGLLGRGVAFVEVSFSCSRLRRLILLLERLYPARVYSLVDRLNTAIPLPGASPPVLFALAYLLFLSLGSVSLLSFSLVVLFLLVFHLSFRLASGIRARRLPLERHAGRLGVALLLLSLLALCLDLYRAYTVPLLDPQARLKLSVAYTYAATFLVPGGVLIAAVIGRSFSAGRLPLQRARTYSFLLAAAVIFMISLLGYRTQSVVSLLAFAIVMHRYRIIGTAEVLLALGGVLLSVALVGYYRAAAMGSDTGIVDAVAGRAALTLMLYDYVVGTLYQKGLLLTGYYRGEVALATFSSFLDFVPGYTLGPRTIVAGSFGVTGVSLTSTLLGTVVLDLGAPGVVLFALALGAVLGATHALSWQGSTLASALFATCFAYLIVGIETGLVDFNVFVLYGSAAFLTLASVAGDE